MALTPKQTMGLAAIRNSAATRQSTPTKTVATRPIQRVGQTTKKPLTMVGQDSLTKKVNDVTPANPVTTTQKPTRIVPKSGGALQNMISQIVKAKGRAKLTPPSTVPQTPNELPTTPATPAVPAAPPPITMDDVKQYVSQTMPQIDTTVYDSKVDELQKMIDEQKQKYAEQINQYNYMLAQGKRGNGMGLPMLDGKHRYRAPGFTGGRDSEGFIVGRTGVPGAGEESEGNAVNEALFRYMKNIWNGGF